jgi:AAA domain, putative AbiEii toxin, Type IV TA system
MRRDPQDDLQRFVAWAEPWMDEIEVRDLQIRTGDKGRMLDLYCREVGSHSDRELFWIGDGIQVWVQLLAHVYRARAVDTVILDEPDLYLHADLQRRLVRLLESLDAQTIAASHSSELLAEAAPRAVTWISKERRRAVRAPDERLLGQLSNAIGSQFNLRLARTLRARAVLFVEGDDLAILRHLADTCGVPEVARETALVTVPLRGYSNWEHVEPFGWLLKDLLEGSVKVLVLLDRDYRTEGQCRAVRDRLHRLGIQCHIWQRKELESYLLVPSVIARLSGAPVADVETALVAAADQQREAVFARQLAERTRTEVDARRHAVEVTESHQREFEKRWTKVRERPHWCNAKELLGSLNNWLVAEDYKPVGADQIARKMRAHEIPHELAELLKRAEALLAS